ncbi:hypothetical protein CBL_00762 [Carabus blaptoides fortunei]
MGSGTGSIVTAQRWLAYNVPYMGLGPTPYSTDILRGVTSTMQVLIKSVECPYGNKPREFRIKLAWDSTGDISNRNVVNWWFTTGVQGGLRFPVPVTEAVTDDTTSYYRGTKQTGLSVTVN